MKISFVVSPGSIDINHIDLYHATKDFLRFIIDTKQKYPEFQGCDDDTLYFGTNERTLNKNSKSGATYVQIVGIYDWFLIPGGNKQTHLFCNTNRYGFDVCLTRDGRGKTVWESNEAVFARGGAFQ